MILYGKNMITTYYDLILALISIGNPPYSEHNIHHPGVGVTRCVSVLKKHDENVDLGLIPVGKNKGHMDYLEKEYAARLNDSMYHETEFVSMENEINKSSI